MSPHSNPPPTLWDLEDSERQEVGLPLLPKARRVPWDAGTITKQLGKDSWTGTAAGQPACVPTILGRGTRGSLPVFLQSWGGEPRAEARGDCSCHPSLSLPTQGFPPLFSEHVHTLPSLLSRAPLLSGTLPDWRWDWAKGEHAASPEDSVSL